VEMAFCAETQEVAAMSTADAWLEQRHDELKSLCERFGVLLSNNEILARQLQLQCRSQFPTGTTVDCPSTAFHDGHHAMRHLRGLAEGGLALEACSGCFSSGAPVHVEASPCRDSGRRQAGKSSCALSVDTDMSEEERSFAHVESDTSTSASSPSSSSSEEHSIPNTKPQLLVGEATTLIVRRLPARCSQRRLLEDHFHQEPGGSYDFLLVPYNPEQRRPCQYCFINFVSPSKAQEFVDRWDGQCLETKPQGKQRKALDIQVAPLQGLRALIEEYVRLMGLRREFRPAVFHRARRIWSAEEALSISSRWPKC